MRLFCQRTFVTLIFVFLIGCQTTSGVEPFFHQEPSVNADTQIVTAIYNAMQSDVVLAPIASVVQIQSEAGVVTMRGYVKTIRQSDMALDIASKINGVKLVRNGLIVRK